MEAFSLDWLSHPAAWVGLLTLVVLEIVLGIDNITGSIEVGKDANVVISEGDHVDCEYFVVSGWLANSSRCPGQAHQADKQIRPVLSCANA